MLREAEIRRKFLTAFVVMEEIAREEFKEELTPKISRDTYKYTRELLRKQGCPDADKVAAAITLHVRRTVEDFK